MRTPEDLFRFLDSIGVETVTHHHPKVFTVEESRQLRGDLPGGHCKSLFLRDKGDGLWLVVALESRRVVLKTLRHELGARKGLSFASPEILRNLLGVEPGAVTPFALLNDREKRVQAVLDEDMLAIDPLNFHPLRNDRTTAVTPEGLLRFVRATGHEPRLVRFEDDH